MKYIVDVLTSRDNVTFSMSKLIALMGTGAMVGEFIYIKSADFQGLGIALTALIGSLAAKSFVDAK